MWPCAAAEAGAARNCQWQRRPPKAPGHLPAPVSPCILGRHLSRQREEWRRSETRGTCAAPCGCGDDERVATRRLAGRKTRPRARSPLLSLSPVLSGVCDSPPCMFASRARQQRSAHMCFPTLSLQTVGQRRATAVWGGAFSSPLSLSLSLSSLPPVGAATLPVRGLMRALSPPAAARSAAFRLSVATDDADGSEAASQPRPKKVRLPWSWSLALSLSLSLAHFLCPLSLSWCLRWIACSLPSLSPPPTSLTVSIAGFHTPSAAVRRALQSPSRCRLDAYPPHPTDPFIPRSAPNTPRIGHIQHFSPPPLSPPHRRAR